MTAMGARAAVPKAPPPPEAFLEQVRQHLAPEQDKFNYQQQLYTYLSHERFERWVALIGRHRPVEGRCVLSSGCGSGGSLVAHWEAGAARVEGVEVDPGLAELATLRVTELPGVEAHLYDGGCLPFESDSFDVVDSLDVLEHVADARLYVAELARVMRAGGCCLLVTPNRLFPVEQHVNVVGPPWLPIRLANVAFYRVGEVVERRNAELGWRMRSVRAVRERNVSFRALRRLAVDARLRLESLHPEEATSWPQPPDPDWVRTLAQHRFAKFVAPTRHLVVLLWKSHRGDTQLMRS